MYSYLKKHFIIFLIIKVLIVMIFCFVYSIKGSGITKDILTTPLTFPGADSSMLYMFEKNIMETGWVFSNVRLGAPFIGEYYDLLFVNSLNFDILILKLILYFSPNVFVASSIYWIILPAFIGVITFFSLRALNTPDWINMGGAIVYAFLPFYYLRGLNHFGLCTYQFVPLVFLLCVWGYQQKIFTSFSKSDIFNINSYKSWLSIIICLLIANNGNGYWQAFSCFFLMMTGFLSFVDSKQWKFICVAKSNCIFIGNMT